MADARLHVEVRSPDGETFSGGASHVLLPATKGSMGVLPRHAPFVSSLEMGLTRVRAATGVEHEFVTGDGFVEIQDDNVLVLVDSAEYVGRIDIDRAEAARARALERLRAREGAIDETRAEAALRRAMTRLRLAKPGAAVPSS